MFNIIPDLMTMMIMIMMMTIVIMSKRQRFPKLKENIKLIKPKNEINGNEELLEENNRYKQLDTCSTYSHNRNNE
jgi:hypothetical protein